MGRPQNVEARRCILSKALGLFYENGFKGVSMDQVAAAAGIKKANLFHYYPSKEALGEAVLELADERHRAQIAERLESDSGDPVGTVRRLFAETGEFLDGKGCRGGCFIGNLAQEVSDHSERLRRRLADHFDFWTRQLEAFLARAKARRVFRKEFDPAEAAGAIVALYEGAILTCKARKDPAVLGLAGSMAESYLKGFQKGVD